MIKPDIGSVIHWVIPGFDKCGVAIVLDVYDADFGEVSARELNRMRRVHMWRASEKATPGTWHWPHECNKARG